MKFKNELISGVLVKRYKRFFADIKIDNKKITAHCPNTGSMMGLLNQGNKVWVSKTDDPNRKLKYTLETILVNGSKVGVNTHFTNKIFKEALENNLVDELKNNDEIRTEVKYGKDTRFDFLITKKNFKAFVEVKNVTLSRFKGTAEFPDSVTSRGLKHIKNLLLAKKEGFEIYLAFIIQRENCNKFLIAKDIDPEYWKLLTTAVNNNLKILCYDCKFSTKGIKLNNKIKFHNE